MITYNSSSSSTRTTKTKTEPCNTWKVTRHITTKRSKVIRKEGALHLMTVMACTAGLTHQSSHIWF